MTPDEIKAAFEALGVGRLEPLTEALADDVVLEFPGARFGGTFEGRRKVAVFLKRNQRLFDGGLHFTVRWVERVGDRAVVQWTNAGRTKTGTDYENRGVTILRFQGDRIVRIDDYLDTERLAETWPA
jgi:ketosteroid isomerase-like protein